MFYYRLGMSETLRLHYIFLYSPALKRHKAPRAGPLKGQEGLGHLCTASVLLGDYKYGVMLH